MSDFSDFIIFVDESGIPNLDGIDDSYPIFSLAFVIINKDHYCDVVVPKIQKLKMNYIGHDQVILHERDIRRQSNQFSFLQVNQAVRVSFLKEINDLFDNIDVKIVSVTIDKKKLKDKIYSTV